MERPEEFGITLPPYVIKIASKSKVPTSAVGCMRIEELRNNLNWPALSLETAEYFMNPR